MAGYLLILKNLLNKPSTKFKLNIFFFKDSLSLNWSTVMYPHLFLSYNNNIKTVKLKFISINLYGFFFYLFIILFFLNLIFIIL